MMLECLLEDIGMRRELTMLQDIFCMRSLAMVEWVRKFCRNLNRDITLSSLKHNDLTSDLQVYCATTKQQLSARNWVNHSIQSYSV